MFFCKIVARLGLPQHTHEMTWRCVAIVGFDALFFRKLLARWVYKTLSRDYVSDHVTWSYYVTVLAIGEFSRTITPGRLAVAR
jgi:hypothetical protein